MEKLDGSWKLVYTSNSELIALLALSRLPFVTIGDVTQRVDAASSTVENKVRRLGRAEAAPRRGAACCVLLLVAARGAGAGGWGRRL
jgi:hypothetical protein